MLRRVNNSGDMSWHKGRVFISEVLRFEIIGFEQVDEDFYKVYFDFYKVYFRDVEIGEFDAEALRFRPVQVLRGMDVRSQFPTRRLVVGFGNLTGARRVRLVEGGRYESDSEQLPRLRQR